METDESFVAEARLRLRAVQEAIAAALTRAGRPAGSVELVAVTKTLPLSRIPALAAAGFTDCGENRPQELARRQPLLPGLRWHMIGHLQRNKVALVLSHATLIHSVDSLRLLEEVEKEAAKKGVTARVLLQVNGSREPQKGGFEPDEVPALAQTVQSLRATRVEGLMTMAALSDDPESSRPAFRMVRELAQQLKSRVDPELHPMDRLSMGMSGDYQVAIEEGATLVRVGSALFQGLEA